MREIDEPPPPRQQGSRGRGEFALIAGWRTLLPSTGPDVLGGPGGDVAWLAPTDGPLAVSTDALVEGVHFRRHWCAGEAIGWKAVAAALSDLAAAAARPMGLTLTLSVPAADLAEPSWLDAVVRGVAQAAEEFGCPVIGGDTTAATGGAVIGITVIGESEAAIGARLGRSGARPGDLLQLSGETGWAGLAVRDLLAGDDFDRDEGDGDEGDGDEGDGDEGDGDEGDADGDGRAIDRLPPAARRAWSRPRARLDLRRALALAHASIDLSDGLLADARHLADASAVQLVLDPAALVPAGLVAAVGPREARRLALTGGEDYELLVAAAELISGFEVVGRVEAGAGLVFDDGSPLPAGPHGWEHSR